MRLLTSGKHLGLGLNALRSVLVVAGAAGLAGQTAPLGADLFKAAPAGNSASARRLKPASFPFFFEAGSSGLSPRFTVRRSEWSAALAPQSVDVSLARSGAYRMTWSGAMGGATIDGESPLPGVSNYFVGSDRTQWRTGVQQFGTVKARQVYPGIDVLYYGSDAQLEYDLQIAAHADPSPIRMEFSGAAGLRVTGEGELAFQVDGSEVRHLRPKAHQLRDGTQVPVAVSYRVEPDRRVAFELGDYDPALPLVIDPVLSFSTYLADSDEDYVNGIAVDGSGFIYVTGTTTSSGFLGSLQGPSGYSDVFVAKLDPTASRVVYSTYLGSSWYDNGAAIAVDSSGQAYVTGSASGANFPLVNALSSSAPAQLDRAFVAKLNANGDALIYSTFLSAGPGRSVGTSIAVDPNGNAVVGGSAGGGVLLQNPYQAECRGCAAYPGSDGFLVKLSSDGSQLIFGTYLGGSATEDISGVALDPSGNVLVAGSTISNDFPLVNAVQGPEGTADGRSAAFVAKFNASGSELLYSTYLGTSAAALMRPSSATAIAADSDGAAYVTGWTQSVRFPLLNSLRNLRGTRNCFVAKLSSAGSLVLSTLFGGSFTQCNGLALGNSGSIAIVGYTSVNDIPLVDSFQTSGSNHSGFVAVLDNAGASVLFSSLLGSPTYQNGLSSVAADASGNLYVGGSQAGAGYPLVHEILTSRSGTDGTVSQIQTASSCTFQVSPSQFSFAASATPREYTVNVASPPGCVWNAISDSQYLQLISPADGGIRQRPGTVTFSYSYYEGPDLRIGLVVAGRKVSVDVTGYGCNWVVPEELTLGLQGGPAYFSVSSLFVGCGYEAVSNNSWIKLIAPTTGASFGSIGFSADPSQTARSGSISVGGHTVTIREDPSGVSTGITSPAPGSHLSSQSVVFTWWLSQGYLTEGLSFGSAPGGSDLGRTSSTATSALVHGLPNDGSPVYVRLRVRGPAGVQFVDAAYTAFAGPAEPLVIVDDPQPSSGSGVSVNLKFQAYDANGATDLTQVWVWFTNSVTAASAANSCLFRFEPGLGLISLLGDDGETWTSLALGWRSGAILQNSQCSVDVGFSLSNAYPGMPPGANRFVTLETPIIFNGSFAGLKQIGMYAVGNAGVSGSWQSKGTWNVPGPDVPTVVSLSPATGRGSAGNFVFRFRNPAGFETLRTQMWFRPPSNTGSPANTCFVTYWPESNMSNLYLDDGVFATGGTLGTPGEAHNSRCSIDLSRSAAVIEGDDVVVTLALRFAELFTGAQDVWMRAFSYYVDSGYRKMGSWTVLGNLAFHKNASQSSTSDGASAAIAVDGLTDGVYPAVTNTLLEPNPWWEVDLGASARIGAISIWNRTDCCSERLSDYWIFVSDTPFGPSDTPAALQQRAGTWSAHQSSWPQPFATVHAGGARGRYVRVQLAAAGYLSLAEVQIDGAVASDFNGNGLSDMIWQDPVSGWAQVWYLGGAQGVTTTGAANLTALNTWRIVGVADFDRDGHPDVVWEDPVTGAAQVWFLGGPGGNVITSAATISAANTWRIMSIADFNGDGIPDCIWQDQASGWAQIWFMGGAQGTTVTGAVNLTTQNTWRIAGTGDFNGDGVPDVVWQDPVTGATQVWYLGGAQGNFVQSAATLAGSNSWKLAAIADFNGDGHPDVVWQDPATGASQVWFLSGTQGITVSGSAAMGHSNTWRIMGPH